MIKAVIFDVGGVLVRTHDHSGRRYWEEKLGLGHGGTDEVVFNSKMGTNAQLGAISNDDLWQWIGEHLSLTGETLRRFRRDFWAGDRLDEALVAYIRSLRPRYQTAIISNATDSLRQTLVHHFAIADAFDLIVGSAEERLMKPNPKIYRRTLQRLQRGPEESVFVDDNEENVAAARELGMFAVHFRPNTDVPAELSAFGVKPSPGGNKLLKEYEDV